MSKIDRWEGPTTEIDVQIDTSEFELKLAAFLNENAETIAKQIAQDARATTAFSDVTGTLRKSIRARKSKFEDGGWIVVAAAPHAQLIEFGTRKDKRVTASGKVTFARKGGKTGARPFLRPALDRNVNLARQLFGTRD